MKPKALHIRNKLGRPLCGAAPTRAGWLWAQRGEDPCARCAARQPPPPPAPTDEEAQRIERSWREGWAVEFPGAPWPGLREAQRRIRAKEAQPPPQPGAQRSQRAREALGAAADPSGGRRGDRGS